MSRRIVRQQSLLAAVPYLLRRQQLRWAHGPSPRGRSLPNKKTEGKSEWWTVDGEMHEVGEHVPHRERFVIPRDNLPNKRRKQMREQFMRSTRLVLKDTVWELIGNVARDSKKNRIVPRHNSLSGMMKS